MFDETPGKLEKTQVEVHPLHELAEAIRRGCALRPNQVRGVLLLGPGGACALGAALAALGRDKDVAPSYRTLEGEFPQMDRRVIHPVTGHDMNLTVAITTLNDDHDWTREGIADWLDTITL